MTLRALLFLFGLLLTAPAWAADYTTPSLDNFAHTLVHFGAIDMANDALLDEYAMITDCNIVENFYSNDFKWRQVRSFIRDSIKMNAATFPVAYHYDAELQLDRYDFKDKNFRLTEGSAIQGVNTFNFTFVVRVEDPVCDGRKLNYLPGVYDVVIGSPVSIGGLPLAENDAKVLLQHLEDAGNKNRIIHARFNMTVIHVDPLHRSNLNEKAEKYVQSGMTGGHGMRLDARLDSVEFYEDADMTRLIYSYTP